MPHSPLYDSQSRLEATSRQGLQKARAIESRSAITSEPHRNMKEVEVASTNPSGGRKRSFLKKNSRQFMASSICKSGASSKIAGRQKTATRPQKQNEACNHEHEHEAIDKQHPRPSMKMPSIQYLHLSKTDKNLKQPTNKAYAAASKKQLQPQRKLLRSQQKCISFLTQPQIQLSPQLFHLYRSETLLHELQTPAITVRHYSKGRRELKYPDGTVEVLWEGASPMELVVWPCGDFKLRDGDKVSFWSEQLEELDQYYLD